MKKYQEDMSMLQHRTGRVSLLFTLLPLLTSLTASAAPANETVVSPVPNAQVSRAQFTTGIADREPIDKLVKVDDSITSIYYFTELYNLQGRKVTHRWEHDGQVISEVSFLVEGPRWRVFSKKTLDPAMLGKWTVFVMDESGWPIHASIFEYNRSPE
jgi:hypothetical protein